MAISLALGKSDLDDEVKTRFVRMPIISVFFYFVTALITSPQAKCNLVLILSMICTFSLTENALHAKLGGKLVSIACLV